MIITGQPEPIPGRAMPSSVRIEVLPKPKGYLAAFNLFCKGERARVEEEPAIKKANLNNNEINKVMGQRWKIADKQVRLKYEEMSRKDKLRYVREVEEYKNRRTCR